MRPVLLTREYPPEVYGGAGIHVEYLARELGRLLPVEVRCFGAEREPGEGPPVRAFEPWAGLGGDRQYAAALRVLSVDLAMTEGLEAATLVHSHTWYANFAGHLAKVMFGLPHVVTTHSFEPHRPWKVQQLGEGGYALSSWCERTALEHADAVIAVSGAMRDAVLELYDVDPARIEVIHNGIDPDEFRPDPSTDALPALRRRPGAAVRPLRRADQPPEGDRPPARGGALARPLRAVRPLRRLGRHGGAARRGGAHGRRAAAAAHAACSGSRRWCRAPT